MTYIPTREQLTDIFTKELQKSSFEDFICKLDMINIYDPTWGGVWKSGIIWMVICRILRERLRPQLWVICVILIFPYLYFFPFCLLSV